MAVRPLERRRCWRERATGGRRRSASRAHGPRRAPRECDDASGDREPSREQHGGAPIAARRTASGDGADARAPYRARTPRSTVTYLRVDEVPRARPRRLRRRAARRARRPHAARGRAHAAPGARSPRAARSGWPTVIPAGCRRGATSATSPSSGTTRPSTTPAARRSRPRRWAWSSRPDEVAYRCNLVTVGDRRTRWSTSPPATSPASRATRSSPRSTPRSATGATACASIPASSTATCASCRATGRRRVRAAARPHRQAAIVLPTGPAAAKLIALMDASKPVVARRGRRGRFGRDPDLALGPGHAPAAARLRRPLRCRPVGSRPRSTWCAASACSPASRCSTFPARPPGFDNDYVAQRDAAPRVARRPRLLPPARRGHRRGRSPGRDRREGHVARAVGRRHHRAARRRARVRALPHPAPARPRDAVRGCARTRPTRCRTSSSTPTSRARAASTPSAASPAGAGTRARPDGAPAADAPDPAEPTPRWSPPVDRRAPVGASHQCPPPPVDSSPNPLGRRSRFQVPLRPGGIPEPPRSDNRARPRRRATARGGPARPRRERMSPEQQIERSVLAGKDRDELHTIAGAIGVKAATRMRKADLIDAILAAANGGRRAGGAAAGDGNANRRPQDAAGALGAARRRLRRRSHRRARRRRRTRSAARRGGRRRAARCRAPRRAAPRPRRRHRRPSRPRPTRRLHPPRRRRRPRRRTGRRRRSTGSTPATARADADGDDRDGTGRRSSIRRTSASRSARATGAGAPARAAARGAARTNRAATAARAEYQGDPIPVQGLLDLRARGLRLPARRRVPPRAEGRVRLGVTGAALRAAQGRLRHAARRARRRATRSTPRCCASTTSTA